MEKKNIITGIKRFFKSRSLKYGSNAAILIAAVIVIAVLVNILVGMTDLKLDLTPNKLFSLTDATRNELKNLKHDVEIIGLFDEGKIASGSEYKQVTDLLSLYEKYPRVKVEYVDPDKNPGIINQLDPDGTMDLGKSDFVVKSVVNGIEKKRKLEYYDLFAVQMDQYSLRAYTTGSNAEQGFTGAIKYVTSENTPVVYFTEGHNETDVDIDYRFLKNQIEKNNFIVKKLNLLSADKIPDDAGLVIVASPKNDITINEKDVLSDYLYEGGKAIFMFDCLASDPDFEQFNSLLAKYNIEINHDKVIENDERRHVPQDPATLIVNIDQNNIIPQGFVALLSNSRSIGILKNVKEYIKTTTLMKTSENAVGQMVSKSRGEDLKGPLDIAVAVEYTGGKGNSKIVVIGNGSFVSDNAINFGDYFYNNVVFFLQTMNWMIDKQDEVIVPTKDYEINTLDITQAQAKIMGWALIVVFPLLILGTGLMVFLRRRHL
ncbi:MAG: GldG family protein [Acetivibrionales bacterium]|jgi:ABC-2 type transport system permease protein